MSARRIVAGVVDQGLSSVSNLVFVFALARVADLGGFASFSLAFAFFAFGLGAQRAFLGTLVSLSRRSLYLGDLLLSVAWALVVGAAGVTTAWLTGMHGVPSFLLMLGLAVIYPQDLMRFRRIADGQHARAVRSDGAWALVTVAIFAGTVTGHISSPVQAVLIWLLGGSLTALVLIVDPANLKARSKDTPTLVSRPDLFTLLPDAVLSQVVPVVVASVVAAQMTVAAVAAQRGVSTLMSPVSLLLGALPIVVLPLLSRLPGRARERASWVQSGVVALLIALWGCLLLVLPAAFGSALLGEAWTHSRDLVLLAVLEMVIWGTITGFDALNRSHRRWGTLLAIRTTYAVVALLVLAFTVRSGDMRVVLGGMIASALVFLLLSVLAARKHRSAAHPAEGEATSPAGVVSR